VPQQKVSKCFDTTNGDMIADIVVPGVYIKFVQLSYSDKEVLVIYEDRNKDSYINIYKTKDVIDWGKQDGGPKELRKIKGPRDHIINCAKFGALDETVYYCTDAGRLLQYSIEESSVIKAESVNRNEIFNIYLTEDFTMLFTCSRDGTCKLLHPETFDLIREFNFTFPCRNAVVSPLYLAD